MKTKRRAPHFLRVTQALALASGVGTAFLGCGGQVTAGGPPPDGDAASECDPCLFPGTLPAPEDAQVQDDFVGGGVFVPPDAANPDDAEAPYDGFSGARDAPDDRVFEGIGLAPDAGAHEDANGGPDAADDAHTVDVVNGILIAPEGGVGDARTGFDGGGPFDLPDLPSVAV
jgi:hypothetical protein